MKYLWHLLLPLFVTATVLAQPTIRVQFPAARARLDAIPRTYLSGHVTPHDTPLMVNGQTVTPWRTGSFVCMVDVKPGTNVVTITAGRTELKHTFFVAHPPAPLKSRLRVLTPTSATGVHLNTKIPLVCTAPPNQQITATVGERTIPLIAASDDATRYSGHITFTADVENVPISFHGPGTMRATGGQLSARQVWPAYRISGPLFETRAFAQPGSGATLAFFNPDHKLILQGAGFSGNYIALWLNNRIVYVHKNYLTATQAPPAARTVSAPDLRRGWESTPPRGKKANQLTIVLDPGHGGNDTGAIGPSGIHEKKVNLQQAFVMRDVLRKAGFKVVMTRESDKAVGLYERAHIAFKARADAFISIHYNATAPQTDPRRVRHTITYAWNAIGHELAGNLQPQIAAVTPIADRGVGTAAFVVCRNPIIPSCLLELDFINCPEGEEVIQTAERQAQVAQAILAGLKAWADL